MISYKVTYQTRHKEGVSVNQGDWQDKEMVVMADEDAREAIDEVVNTIRNSDFRLIGVEIVGQVDIVIDRLLE